MDGWMSEGKGVLIKGLRFEREEWMYYVCIMDQVIGTRYMFYLE